MGNKLKNGEHHHHIIIYTQETWVGGGSNRRRLGELGGVWAVYCARFWKLDKKRTNKWVES